MKLQTVKKVTPTTDPDEVNAMLDSGWVLLKVDTTTFDNQKDMTYVLGWTHRESEEEFKKMVEPMPF